MAARALLLAAALAGALLLPATAGAAGPLTVFGASDLAFAFEEIVPRFERASGATVRVVLGSTGNLARQIEQGAPADVFLAADAAFVDALAETRAIRPETRTLYALGRIVLASRRDAAAGLRSLADLRRPEVRRVAIANPAHAPYGRAAKEALEAAGLFAEVRPKLVFAETVRHALQFLETGAADGAVIARSIAGAPGIDWSPIDAALHRPLDQTAAVTARSRHPDLAAAFIRFVTGPEGRSILARYGFDLPPREGS